MEKSDQDFPGMKKLNLILQRLESYVVKRKISHDSQGRVVQLHFDLIHAPKMHTVAQILLYLHSAQMVSPQPSSTLSFFAFFES